MTIMKANTEQADRWYQRAESKAARYLDLLQEQLRSKSYVSRLLDDFIWWKKKHLPRQKLLPIWRRGAKPPDSSEGSRFLAWLARAGKLDDYLERSVSYMYLRDLGQDLSDPRTRAKIQRMAGGLKKSLVSPDEATVGTGIMEEMISLASVYRWAQREGVEEAVIWGMERLKGVRSHLPPEMNAEEAERKLIKIILGVVMHVMDEMEGHKGSAERSRWLGEAIKLGYYYGLTYPFIDDLLDSGALNAEEQEQYSRMIRLTIRTGIVPELGEWSGRHQELVRYIHTELREAYEFIRGYQNPGTQDVFFEQSYIFFESQDADRCKTLHDAHYTNEELYLPIILKSASSRLIVRSVISAPQDEGFDQRVFYYGLYNQLADDFADMAADLDAGVVTPYTYYLTYRHERPDLINPFELYWAVISHLIHHVYRSEPQTREIILARAINGLKRYQRRVGVERFHEVLAIFSIGHPELEDLIQLLVRRAADVDFYDKWLRDQLLMALRANRQEQEAFVELVQTARKHVDAILPITSTASSLITEDPLLVDTANYSLEGSGKRLRPILAWVMGVQVYGLDPAALSPLFRALEYMHTASLIFDDLPSQDNSPSRRGKPTLHEVHNSAIAELTGIFLIQKAVEEQASLKGFDNESVLALLQYLSRKAGEICMGQAMDLNAKGKVLTVEELDRICFYKTGIAFEACLVAPAILARANETEIAVLKNFAYHTGIAFQIKDDLLDGEGDPRLLGKPTGKDIENGSSTYVTVLGTAEANKAMWEHYCLAMEALMELPKPPVFLKHLLHYIINRET
ncbi:polyprenyl synthetase family protein [Paenibacillus sp. p3-SID1389]|uniref:polyprenyl synthetase family protein n=1 Tax=Paenibacillus sp. p3-SID1389 TaxID=2916364 RepID=UPI0021A35EC9|nr:polyprenyl synthetase family protein [Paenibacillus sp. p3-SID1389]MCT2194506.1 polyprenyl synthetase family protein [Paenibacillus sp. p3-SID1389]